MSDTNPKAPEGAIAIPEDLQELLDGSYAISVWHVDGEHEVVHNYSLGMLIDRIAALTQRAELAESRVKELSKPVTDEEWASTAKWPKGVWRDHLDALIAARSPGMSYEEIQAAYDKRIADSALCSGVHRR